jgi:hypothetical protein
MIKLVCSFIIPNLDKGFTPFFNRVAPKKLTTLNDIYNISSNNGIVEFRDKTLNSLVGIFEVIKNVTLHPMFLDDIFTQELRLDSTGIYEETILKRQVGGKDTIEFMFNIQTDDPNFKQNLINELNAKGYLKISVV